MTTVIFNGCLLNVSICSEASRDQAEASDDGHFVWLSDIWSFLGRLLTRQLLISSTRMIVLAEVAPCWVFFHIIVLLLGRESGRRLDFGSTWRSQPCWRCQVRRKQRKLHPRAKGRLLLLEEEEDERLMSWNWWCLVAAPRRVKRFLLRGKAGLVLMSGWFCSATEIRLLPAV